MAIIEIKVPSPGESITHVEIYKWLVSDGDIVKKDTEIAELESEKATLTLVADKGGKISILAKEGDSLEVGAVACTIDTSFSSDDKNDISTNEKIESKIEITKEKEEKPKQISQIETKQIEENPYENVKTTPLAQQLMEENNLTIEDVISGLKRLKRSDIEAILTDKRTVKAQKKQNNRAISTNKMSALRRKLSERLVAVKNETAMLTTFNEVDMKAILDLRKKHQDKFVQTHGVKLGMMSFFLKAAAIALQEFPAINSMIDGENTVTFDYADISVAVSTPKGLLVPVIRNVEDLSLAEIEKKLIEVADKARNGSLSIPEMTGGTFTITNGGIFGSLLSTPIINPPQSAILGMHNIVERPVVADGQIVARPMMYIALSYDHRIVDGRESVSFLVRIKQLIENPVDLMFGKGGAVNELLEI